tara:strand:- start:381 stop:947 length:567 start_codon:yes stop_codon:yes gene_type:complete
MFKTIELFKTNLYYKEIKNIDHKKIKKYVNTIKKEEHKITASNVGGYHSQYFYSPFPSCLDKLNNEINGFLKESVRKEYLCKGEVFIHNSWFISNKTMDFNKPHKHPPYSFSGVYYIDVPENSGDIVFHNQFEMNNYAMYYDKWNALNSKDFRVTPQSGMLLVFPAWLEHYVTPNKNKKERLIYSFNA